MKKISFVVTDFFKNNRVFDLNDSVSNRDNCLYSFFLLREEFKKYGYDLSTQDVNSPEKSEYVIYNEMPRGRLPKENDKQKSFLLLFESELIRPDNWDLKKHNLFHKVFTWDDRFIDNDKYIKHCFNQKINRPIPNTDEKLCTLIAGNKLLQHPLELYSERKRAIEWFEKYHPTDFDYYGIGWENVVFSSKVLTKLSSCLGLSKKASPCYKGKISTKLDVYSKYSFCICYENAHSIPGYITEKIFDAFMANCIPIYWGPSNIAEIIPPLCFIDRRSFSSYDDLFVFIKGMSADEKQKRREAIRLFLESAQSAPFKSETSVDVVVKNVLGSDVCRSI